MTTEFESEFNLFVSGQSSNSVKSITKLAKEVNEETFKQLLQLCCSYHKNGTISRNDYIKAKNSSNLQSHQFDLLFNGLILLTRNCLRLPKSINDKNNLKTELAQRLKLPQYYVKVFESYLFDNKDLVKGLTMKIDDYLPRLQSFRWRFDLGISNRKLEPIIVFELITTKHPNQRIIFECKLSQFHSLRFAVANALKELNQLEQRNVIKG